MLLFMGLDLVYWNRKAGPRALIIVLVGIFCFVLLFMFLSQYGSLAMLAGLVLTSSLMFGYLGIEHYKGKAYVRGELDGVFISDLTKAIYWLSYIGADRVPGLGGYGGYWKRVRKIAPKISGDFLARWHGVEGRYSTSTRLRAQVKVHPLHY